MKNQIETSALLVQKNMNKISAKIQSIMNSTDAGSLSWIEWNTEKLIELQTEMNHCKCILFILENESEETIIEKLQSLKQQTTARAMRLRHNSTSVVSNMISEVERNTIFQNFTDQSFILNEITHILTSSN